MSYSLRKRLDDLRKDLWLGIVHEPVVKIIFSFSLCALSMVVSSARQHKLTKTHTCPLFTRLIHLPLRQPSASSATCTSTIKMTSTHIFSRSILIMLRDRSKINSSSNSNNNSNIIIKIYFSLSITNSSSTSISNITLTCCKFPTKSV